ncbi:MAG: MobF family relaxase [Pseudomonadota bacterium]
MLSVCGLDNHSSGAIKDVGRYMRATEYYRAGIGAGAWLGEGAKALGLTEADANAQFEALLSGHAPDGKKVVRNAGAMGRRMGWDLTFSADKSVSIVFAAASEPEQRRILEAHHRATTGALGYLQEQLISRTGAQGQGPSVAAGDGVIIRRVDHLDSREGDPQLHSHCVLLNVAKGPDGKWRTMDERALFDHKHAAGAIYRHALAREMKGLGYGIESQRERDVDGRETGQVWHHIAGVGPEAMRHFSKRRQAIEAAMSADGLSAQEATMRTRRGKTDENHPERIMEGTREALADLCREGVVAWEQAAELRGVPSQGLDPRNESTLLADLHRTESAFDRRHLIDRLAKERLDLADPVKAADECLKQWHERGMVVRLADDAEGRARWCSQEQWALEEAITRDAVARKDDTTHRLARPQVEQAIAAHETAQGFTLTDEQRKAVFFVACESGGVACLSGQAGTGKTATAGAYLGAYKAAGFQLVGTSTAQRAAEKLEAETGMPSMSCAKLLSAIERGDLVLTPQTVVTVDEAGMVGAKTLRQIQEAVDQAGAKMLLLGDALQLQPVEAGAPFRLMAHEVGEAKLTEIRRQKQDADKALARAFYEGARGASIVADWEKREQLHTREGKAEAIAALAKDVLDNPKPLAEKLIIANTRADCAAITQAVRAGLIERGELGRGERIEVAGKLAGQRESMEVREGERIAFQKNDRRLGVANGDVGVVEAITTDRKGRVALSVRLESEVAGKAKKRITVHTESYDRLGYAYASTTHAAQGQGKADVYWLAAPGQGMDRNMGLVAFTRTKDRFAAYVSEHDKARLVERLDSWGTKQAARELVPHAQAKGQELGQSLGSTLVDLRAWKAERDLERAEEHQRAMRQAAEAESRPTVQKPPAPEGARAEGGIAAIDAQIHRLEDERERLRKEKQGIDGLIVELGIHADHGERALTSAKRAHAAADAKVQAWKEKHPWKLAFGKTEPLEELRAARKAEAVKVRQIEKDVAKVGDSVRQARQQEAQVRASITQVDGKLHDLFAERERIRKAEWAAMREESFRDPELQAWRQEVHERVKAMARGETPTHPSLGHQPPLKPQPTPTLRPRGPSR